MGVSTDVTEAGYTLQIDGRFDLSLYDTFEAAYSTLTSNSTQIIVDLSQTDYLDSSALGMLLMLREHFDSTSEIILLNPNSHVGCILATANFDKLFSICSPEWAGSSSTYNEQYASVKTKPQPLCETS